MNAQARGWGSACKPIGGLGAVTLSNGVKITVANGIAPIVKYLGDETISRGYVIRSGVTGGYNCRQIRGSSSWSNHAWGLAVDLNWDKNPMGSALVTDMPEWMPQLWESFGFRWGGLYSSRPDAMHYEFMGTPAQARAYADRTGLETISGSEKVAITKIPGVPNPTLKLGAKGPRTKQLQRSLRAISRAIPGVVSDPGAVDGVFGSKTESSVKDLQGRILMLTPDGIYGAQTGTALAAAKRVASS